MRVESARLGRPFWTAVLVLAAATAYLRLTAISWGAPFVYHPDEHFVLHRALDIARTGDPNPGWFEYPSFLIYVQSVLVTVLRPFVDAPLETSAAANGIGPWDALPSQWPFVVAGRVAVALAGVLGVVLLAVAGARLLSPPEGLAAAAFLMAAPLHNESAHYLTTDVPATTFVIAALCAGAAAEPWWLLAGVLAGMAAGTKYIGVVALFAPVILAVQVSRPAETVARLSRLVLGALLGFVVTTPYAVLTPGAFWDGVMTQRGNYLGGIVQGDNWRWYQEYLYHSGMGPLIAVMAALGVVSAAGSILAGIRRRERVGRRVLLLLAPLLYIPWLASYPSRAERNLLVVLPFLCLLAAHFAERVASRLGSASISRLAFAVLALAGVVGSTQLVLQRNQQFAQPDTRRVALEWITATLPPGTKLAREEYTPQVPNGSYDVTYVWSLARRPYGWYVSQGVEYLVASANVYGRSVGPPHLGGPAAEEFYRVLFGLPLAAEFKPDEHTGGPTIRVYKVPRGSS